MDIVEHNTYLVDSVEAVDSTNKEFYERFTYPWKPQVLQYFNDDEYWTDMLNQDVGDFTRSRLQKDMCIWVAGCGTNQALITALKFPAAKVIGSDISSKSLALCQDMANQLGVNNLELREETLNASAYDQEFDYVISTGVIHHNAEPAKPLGSLKKALKKNGVLELMVYNLYHRIITTAYQKAVRKLCSPIGGINTDDELTLTLKLIENFPVENSMKQFLSMYQNVSDAELGDTLLQPVEYSYTVESLNRMAEGRNLTMLQPCINQFDKLYKRYDWNMSLDINEFDELYFYLPDLDRWNVSNLMMQELSPHLWFYFQRVDSDYSRKSEKAICEDFLDTKFTHANAKYVNYLLDNDGNYSKANRENTHPAPPRPVDPVCKRVFENIDGVATVREIFDKLELPLDFSSINKIRLQLATSGFGYLKSIRD